MVVNCRLEPVVTTMNQQLYVIYVLITTVCMDDEMSKILQYPLPVHRNQRRGGGIHPVQLDGSTMYTMSSMSERVVTDATEDG